jgi:tRNA pseudouridine-54 N-methylase
MYCFYCCYKRATESNVNDNSVNDNSIDINASLLNVSVNRYLELMKISNDNYKLLAFLKKNGHNLDDPQINNFIVPRTRNINEIQNNNDHIDHVEKDKTISITPLSYHNSSECKNIIHTLNKKNYNKFSRR